LLPIFFLKRGETKFLFRFPELLEVLPKSS
jgi:hypothetical protein